MKEWVSRNQYSLLAISMGVFFFLIILACAYKYLTLGYTGFDLAIIHQVFWNSSQGRWFEMSLHPTLYLAEHFKPIIVLLVPFYAIVPHPFTLIVLQAVALMLGAIPVFHIARRIGSSPATALLAVSIYLFNPITAHIALNEFHLFPFAVPLVLVAIYYYFSNRFSLFSIWGALALLVREDVPLLMGVFGILALLERRAWRWVFVPVLGSGLYFFLAQKIINHFAPWHSYKYLEYYGWLGSNFSEIFFNFFTRLPEIVAKVLSYNALEFIAVFLVCFLFLPLRKPKYLLLAAPHTLIYGLHSGFGWEILRYHYAVPFLVAGTLASTVSLHAWEQGLFFSKLRLRYPHLVPLVFLISLLYLFITIGPIRAATHNSNTREIVHSGWRLLEHIPRTSSVLAWYDLLPELSGRKQVYAFWYAFLGTQQFGLGPYIVPHDLEYIAVTTNDLVFAYTNDRRGMNMEQFMGGPRRIRDMLEQGGFGLIYATPYHALYHRKTDSNDYLYQRMGVLPPDLDSTNQQEVYPGLWYVGSRKHKNGISIFFTAQHPLEHNYLVQYGQYYAPLGYLYPTTEWKVGEIIETVIQGDKETLLHLFITNTSGDRYLDAFNTPRFIPINQASVSLSL